MTRLQLIRVSRMIPSLVGVPLESKNGPSAMQARHWPHGCKAKVTLELLVWSRLSTHKLWRGPQLNNVLLKPWHRLQIYMSFMTLPDLKISCQQKDSNSLLAFSTLLWLSLYAKRPYTRCTVTSGPSTRASGLPSRLRTTWSARHLFLHVAERLPCMYICKPGAYQLSSWPSNSSTWIERPCLKHLTWPNNSFRCAP